MIEALIALLALLAAALGWGKWERSGKLRERSGREQAERRLDIHDQVREADKDIDQRLREAEGSNEERDHRLTDPNSF